MKIPIPVYEHQVIVLLSDIDENQHANNLCYLRWINEAAVAHSAANGWTAQRYLELGSTWFARRHTIDYLAPSLEGDQLTVKTWISELKSLRCTRKYQIVRNRDNVVVSEAETLWVFVNLKTGKPTKIPPVVADSFAAAER